MARRAVIATRRTESDKDIASRASADEVFLTDATLAEHIHRAAPDGVDHIVEVAFAANIMTDIEVLAQGGFIATYATNTPIAEIPVWQLVFINARLFFVGSDDVPSKRRVKPLRTSIAHSKPAGRALTSRNGSRSTTSQKAHEFVEHPSRPGRVL